uniref:Calcium channel toxin CaTx1 n=1 Tax=Odontobuthus doriae TaxID=342590 RepID=A0A0U3YD40_ODODO|nr:calcium channel toxin CaTx1 [Odontobuthus doriae]
MNAMMAIISEPGVEAVGCEECPAHCKGKNAKPTCDNGVCNCNV